ncbi:MAG: rhomboid family intramembrane serine protease [Prosthecobacter sp.]|uniref:rhomboid family protein n=1 Tax=Prosthecobacter sp. TaxID=1965333 RepID=UPI0025E31FAF|nr:rhomboid family intramembrane serine protease [Prosthecobacter sp.]MCF7786598.1 rhomboid family intramembrane serine protease [Prosthecobacter sp.]
MSLYDRDYMREEPPRSISGMVRDITAFHVILGINIAVFVMQFVFETGSVRHPLTGAMYLPLGGVSVDELMRGKLWTLFTYMFVHGGIVHFALNMMLLWFAGRGVQQLFGSRHFTLIYLFSGVAGAATEMAVNGFVLGDMTTPLVGASASVFGLLMALAVVLPDEKITAFIYFIIPVQLRLWTLAKGLFIIQLVFGLAGVLFHVLPEGMKIAYFAHLGGAAVGWFYARSLGYGGRPLTYASQWQPAQYQKQRKRAMARTRVRPATDLELDTAPLASQRQPDSVEAWMEEVVNPLLDKINQHGKDSLTAEEQLTLEHASREVDRHRQAKRG